MAVHEDEYIQRRHLYEEYAFVLDYLPYGRSTEKSRHLVVPTVQIMGEEHFTLLEAELKVGASVVVHERIYIGRERREKVDRILSRISYDQLTANAKAELVPIVEELVKSNETHFIDFFMAAPTPAPKTKGMRAAKRYSFDRSGGSRTGTSIRILPPYETAQRILFAIVALWDG